MHDYQRRRVLTFLNPESDPLGSGYHIIQSKIAVALIVENGGSGGAVAGPIARVVIDRHLLADNTKKGKADAAQ
jgi:hypothetical protein